MLQHSILPMETIKPASYPSYSLSKWFFWSSLEHNQAQWFPPQVYVLLEGAKQTRSALLKSHCTFFVQGNTIILGNAIVKAYPSSDRSSLTTCLFCKACEGQLDPASLDSRSQAILSKYLPYVFFGNEFSLRFLITLVFVAAWPVRTVAGIGQEEIRQRWSRLLMMQTW